MFVFKNIDNASTLIESNVVNYTHNFTTSSLGIKSINIVSGSISSSHWNSLNVLFYTSGSPIYTNGNENKFGIPSSGIVKTRIKGTQYLTKFHGYPSSSLISIPQHYYGEKIKEGSFIFTDKSFTDNAGNNPKIVDDKYGNLYSTNAHYSQSTNHASHSDNYVGNIFYEEGIIVLTETSSWSGSVDYSDIAKDTNFTIQLDSFNTITSHEYSITLNPEEFNYSTNYTMRMPLSGSFKSVNDLTSSVNLKNQWLATEFTGSNVTPYITTINLYSERDKDTPVITATLPKPIKKSNKVATTFKIKLDL